MFFILFIFMQMKFNAQDYPDAGGLIVEDAVELRVDKDYRRIQHRDYKVFIFNTRGRERYSDMFEKYNKKEENYELLKARTVCEDGSVLLPEEKAISDLGTVEGFLAPAYKDLRTRIVSYSGVESGVSLEYESKKSLKEKPDDNYVSGYMVFEDRDPIFSKEFTLRVPEDAGIRYKVYGTNVNNEEKEENDFRIYRWWVKSVPRMKEEPNRMPKAEFASRVFYTNYENWNGVARWLWKKFDASIKLSRQIKERAKDLEGKKKEDVLEEIYDDIAKNWRDIPLGLSDVGFVPNETGDIYNNRYGNQLDKVALFVSLCRAAGFDAFPAYVSFSPVENELPMPDYFGQTIVAIPVDDNFIFADPRFPDRRGSFAEMSGFHEKDNAGFPLLSDVVGRFALIVKPDSHIFTTLPGFDSPVADLEMIISVNEDCSISGSLNAKLNGSSSATARMHLRPKKVKEQTIAVENALGSLKTGTELEDFHIDGLNEPTAHVRIKIDFKCPDYLTKQGANLKFVIPGPIFSFFSSSPYFSLDSRVYPFTVVNARTLDYRIVIKIPENVEIVYMPEKVDISNSSASASSEYECIDNILTIKKRFSFNKADYRPEEYADLQKVYNQYESIGQQMILFRRK